MAAPRGRQIEAARNDHLILDAARAIFVADPTAPISTVAARAGVGIAALYRRYPGKEDLLRTLCAEGLARYIAETRLALSDDGDRWAAFTSWMTRIVDADTNSLVQRLAGTFSPTEAMFRDGAEAGVLTTRLVARTKKAGALRRDIGDNDIATVFEMVASVRLGDEARTGQLRRRYLSLLIDALRAPAPARLPGRPPTWEELERRWNPAPTVIT
jgi:AcrR family transcriptional regulator